jgi:glutaconate CoA-transferase subunit B
MSHARIIDSEIAYSGEDMLLIAAARALAGTRTCCVGIGLPQTASLLARATVSPDLVLTHDVGTFDAPTGRLPSVSTSEFVTYWLQAGRIEVGFVGGAQIDRFANLNTTVIGRYDQPTVRLPGPGAAPNIAGSCRQTFIAIRHSRRTFVERLDFRTTIGHGDGPGDRARFGLNGAGPSLVITDLGLLRPDPETCELTLTDIHPGVEVEAVRQATGWDLAIAPDLRVTPAPTAAELAALASVVAI